MTATVGPLSDHCIDGSRILDAGTTSQQRATEATETGTCDIATSTAKSRTYAATDTASRIAETVADSTTNCTSQASVRQQVGMLTTSGYHVLGGVDFRIAVKIYEGFLLVVLSLLSQVFRSHEPRYD
jgi:hypothetical protein